MRNREKAGSERQGGGAGSSDDSGGGGTGSLGVMPRTQLGEVVSVGRFGADKGENQAAVTTAVVGGWWWGDGEPGGHAEDSGVRRGGKCRKVWGRQVL